VNVSVVVPVYNGEKSLNELNKRLIDSLKKDFEIIYVDDYSKDNSKQVIKKLSKNYNQVKYIFFDENYGQQAAIFAGLKKSIGNIVITIDDDLQHPPEDIQILISELKEHEGIFAFPVEKPHSKFRKMGSYFTDRLFNFILKKDKDINISSFRAIRRELVDRMIKHEKHFIYISALMMIESDKLKTIYNEQLHRKYGNSNYNFKKLVRLYLNIIIYYGEIKTLQSKKPLYKIDEEN
jgi:undecaprenyl-phosphate 4-deoxy-4-formamido-L-arabinose transferase